jgi:hypothetical protein
LRQFEKESCPASAEPNTCEIATLMNDEARCDARPGLAETPLPLEARIDVQPVRGGEQILNRMFEPLGYRVEATRAPLDEQSPEWGDSPYFSVMISKMTTLRDLLVHLFVLVPVFDNQEHTPR